MKFSGGLQAAAGMMGLGFSRSRKMGVDSPGYGLGYPPHTSWTKVPRTTDVAAEIINLLRDLRLACVSLLQGNLLAPSDEFRRVKGVVIYVTTLGGWLL